MKIFGSNIPFLIPARTFIIDGAVAHPVLPFVQALEKEKIRVTSGPGESPIRLRYGSFWKDYVSTEFIPTFMLPEKLGRWELTIDVYIDTAIDHHGNHAVTIASHGSPAHGNDLVFKIVATAADAFAQTNQLLHWTDFFQGDPKAMRAKAKKAK